MRVRREFEVAVANMGSLLARGVLNTAIRGMHGVVGLGKYEIDLLSFEAKTGVGIISCAAECVCQLERCSQFCAAVTWCKCAVR